MNKQELIEKYNSKLNTSSSLQLLQIYKEFIRELMSLDEPEKVKVPQFVADWIEEGRKYCKDVSDLFDFDFTNEEIGNWFLQEKPFDLVARAWLDGYEVEKEPKYTVKIKNTNCSTTFLVFSKTTGEWFFSVAIYLGVRFKHTRKELEEAGFGWVFSCEGIEIEEVQDET